MPRELRDISNAGLVFSRYPRVWTTERGPAKSELRHEFLRNFVAGFAAQAAVQEPLLNQHLARFDHLDGRDFICTGPLVTGVGAEHPLENGFTFHPVLGVPWVPGSAVKGLARAAGQMLNGEVEALLGSPPPSRDKRDETRPGKAVFYGAMPVGWPKLRHDLVNPHHPEYYADQALGLDVRRKVANLVEEPKPVGFLAVAPQTRFRFWIGARSGLELTDDERQTLWQWLEVGLSCLGIGAKTAAGYGHMVPA